MMRSIDSGSVFHWSFLSFILTCWSMAPIFSQGCDNLTGRWVNQDSSLMTIDADTTYFSGSYRSIASGDTAVYALFGTINSAMEPKTLSFSVHWGAYGSITSWTGYCREKHGRTELVTVWHLVRPYVEEDWARFVTNQSIFHPYIDE